MSHLNYLFSNEIRTHFASAMSAMYRAEVPLYADLVEIVEGVNQRVLNSSPSLPRNSGEIARLNVERHGAIRIGTAQELCLMRRAFAIMGMHPVGYYDLSVAGVPVHSTAFRPVEPAALAHNPFRVFTSLLRLELIEDASLRETAAGLLAARNICSAKTVQLIEKAELEGGLSRDDATTFVAELLETFRWHGDASVDEATFAKLQNAHRLIADVVSFRGPHINHLTPRTLDIDAAQAEMMRRGIGAKTVVEGPPRRAVPILLRQTSFAAIEEQVNFAGGSAGGLGVHTARFGEIEQRGIALTRKGRALYDDLLAKARGTEGSGVADYQQRLSHVFAQFPDSLDALRTQKLAYFQYSVTGPGRQGAANSTIPGDELEEWISEGYVAAEPITYEDFLPVSAAGIFQSNLGGAEQRSYSAAASREAFEQALGIPVLDEFAIYEALMQASLNEVCADLCYPLAQIIT